MADSLQELVDGVVWHWCEFHTQAVGSVTYGTDKEGREFADIPLQTDEGEDFTIGNYADPGLCITWLGTAHGLADPHNIAIPLVMVNGVVIQALPEHITGWAIGYDN